jgi:hypothetical protein
VLGLRRRPGQPGWGDLLGSIGRSTVDLLGAEVEGARAELWEVARRAAAAAVVGLAAVALAFWALGAATAAAIAGLTVWLPVWGAALVLFGALGVVAFVLALVTRARIRRLEGPASIVRRRVDDHLEFWRTEVLGVSDELGDEVAGEDVWEPEPWRASDGRPQRGRPPVSVAPPGDDDTEP